MRRVQFKAEMQEELMEVHLAELPKGLPFQWDELT
jgi:hypothetical protein